MSLPFKTPKVLPCLFVCVRVFQKRDHCKFGPQNAIYTNINLIMIILFNTHVVAGICCHDIYSCHATVTVTQ